MAESKEKLKDQSAGLIYTSYKCLRFTVLEPCQSLVFLGFMVHTTKMELSIPPDNQKIRAEARKLQGVELVSGR